MEIVALLFVLTIHHIGKVPEHIDRPAQTCAPQQVVVSRVDSKIVLRGMGARVCFANIR